MAIVNPREAPFTVRVAQKWGVSTYKKFFEGWQFPDIELVPAAPGVPAHGLLHGPEGATAVSVGDYIVVRPSNGAASASSWYAFVGFYEEAQNVPT